MERCGIVLNFFAGNIPVLRVAISLTLVAKGPRPKNATFRLRRIMVPLLFSLSSASFSIKVFEGAVLASSFHSDSFTWAWSGGPCTQVVYTLIAKYFSRDYFKAN